MTIPDSGGAFLEQQHDRRSSQLPARFRRRRSQRHRTGRSCEVASQVHFVRRQRQARRASEGESRREAAEAPQLVPVHPLHRQLPRHLHPRPAVADGVDVAACLGIDFAESKSGQAELFYDLLDFGAGHSLPGGAAEVVGDKANRRGAGRHDGEQDAREVGGELGGEHGSFNW